LKCKDHFGTTPEHIIYLINELEDRVSHIESVIKDRHPVMASAMVKLESMNRALQKNGIVTSKEIDRGVEKIMREIE